MAKFSPVAYALLFVGSIVAVPIDNDWMYARVNQSCERHRECSFTKFAQCSKGKCECLPNYSYSPIGCLGNINAICDSDDDCKDEGQVGCIFNTCHNYTEFFTSSNAEKIKLYRATKIGSRCENDHHCSSIRNTVCTSGKCKCASGYWAHYSDYWTGICRRVTNQTCNKNDDCDEIGTECFLNICMLPIDFFVESNAHNVSLYVAKNFEDACHTDHHCRNVVNTHCDAGSCKCLPDFDYVRQECRKVLNSPCQYEYDCGRPELECLSNICVDPKDFLAPTNPAADLYAARYISHPCRTDHHCRNITNSYCSGGRCTCTEGYREDHLECAPLGYSPCSYYYDCYFGDKCFFNLCYRPSDFFKTSNASLYAAEKLGDICDTDNHCRNMNNSGCVGSYCTCNDNYENYKGQCRKEILHECSNTIDCKKPGYHCLLDTCLKPDKFFIASNAHNASLYAAKSIHDVCRTNHHCRKLSNTHCSGNICDCLPGHEFVGDRCLKALNVTCSHDFDCLMPRSYCFFNTCLYPEDFLAPSSGYNISLYAAKRVGGFCQTEHHCRDVENSMCLFRKCTCQDQYSLRRNKCKYNPLLSTIPRPEVTST